MFYAAAAIGVSHLVQSTRAGASYGWVMVAIVFFANVIKYPLFLIGPIYTYHQKESVLDGFSRLGKWSLFLYLFITLATLFTTVAVIALICSSLMLSVFNMALPVWALSGILITALAFFIYFGRLSRLDFAVKLIVVALTFASISALVFAVNSQPVDFVNSKMFSLFGRTDVLFLIALIGWMPAPLDIIVWQSEWTIERQQKEALSWQEALIDFKIGYWGTTFLAMVFTALGTIILFGQQEALAQNATAFIDQLIHLYTATIGDFAYPFIAFAALATMVSTLLTVIDAYSKVVPKAINALFNLSPRWDKILRRLILLVICLGSTLVLKYGMNSLSGMIDLATSVSFLTAPFLAILFILLLRRVQVHKVNKRPILFTSSIIGLIFLVIFAMIYIYYTFL